MLENFNKILSRYENSLDYYQTKQLAFNLDKPDSYDPLMASIEAVNAERELLFASVHNLFKDLIVLGRKFPDKFPDEIINSMR